MSPLNQSGMSLPFKWTVASSAGRSNLAHVFALFHTTSASTSDACYIHYDASSNLVYLADNASSSWLGGLAPTSDYIAENAQCTIFGTGTSSVNPASSGTQLELTLTVSFKSAFSGNKNEYLYALDGSGVDTGWQEMGTWTVPGPSPVTFNTTPSGLSLQVDGVTYTTPVTLQLSPGNHTVNASIAQGSPAGTRYIFQSWSDSGAAQHTVTTPAAGFTANFTTQYQLTTSANPAAGGTVNPASNWYDLGTPATVTANPNSGYLFTGFSGSTTSTANPFTFTINGPNNLIAGFSVAPPTVSITPPSGAGASQILTAVYIDPVAYGQITEALLLVNSSASTASACYVKWTPGNHFYLRNETDSAWMEGTAASVENSRCRLDAPANGAKGVGQTLTVNFGLTFFSPFSGAKQVYLTTTTGLGTASWQAKGTWTVDRTSGDYTVTAITPSAAGAHMATVQFQYAVRAIGGIDGSTVRVRNQGVYIQNTLNCLGGWNQQGGWDPATRTGTVTLWITLANGCYDQTTFTPEVSWESGGGSGVSKTTTDTTFTCCITAPVSITITPTSTTLRAGQYVRLTAKVEGTDNKNVTWNNPTNGTIDNTGYAMVIYTAPASISTTQYVVLTAHSNQDPSKVASATITLQPAAPTEVPKYVISGTVTQADGSAFGPISINVTGDQAQTVSTLPDGTYSTPSLPAGHYTVKPSSDYGAATPTTYDLVEPRSGNHVMKPFRISPNNVFPPVDESPVESRGVLSVTANGIPKAYDFWWTNSHINSLDIQWPGCWVKPIGSSASYSNSDQSIEVSYTPDASGPHFVITFKAPVNAVLGFRDVVCRYGGKDVVGWDIISIEAADPTVKLISVTWGVSEGAIQSLRKTSAAVAGWSTDTFASDGAVPIDNTTWIDPTGSGTPTTKDPICYLMHSKPAIASAVLKRFPPVSGTAVVRVLASPAELTFAPQTVEFGVDGAATTPEFPSTSGIDKVHNQDYTLTWSISFDNGQTFQNFATTTQKIFVSYAGAQGIMIGGGQQGSATAKRMDYSTRAAEGKTAITGDSQNYGITEAIVSAVAHSVDYGSGVLGRSLVSAQDFWSLLDANPRANADCLALAGLGAFAVAQVGVPAGYSWAYPPLAAPAAPDVTDSTRDSGWQLPQQYQDHPGITYNYSIVYYVPGPHAGYYNEIEGFFTVSDGGVTKAFTVGPPAGPILSTTCAVFPNTDDNKLKFNVISKTLLGLEPIGQDPPQLRLYWRDNNIHSATAPEQGPKDLVRTNCQPTDLTKANPIQ